MLSLHLGKPCDNKSLLKLICSLKPCHDLSFLFPFRNRLIIQTCPPKLKTGSREVEKAVNVVEHDIKLKAMTGHNHQEHHGIGYINTPKAPEESLLNATETLSLDPSKKLMRCKHFKGSSTSTPGTVDKVVELHPAGFLMEVFACITSQPYLVVSIFNFDTLPSPSNLKRWRISCFLCNRTICTTANILGACSVALKQGCFTFRHGNMLFHIFATLKIHKQY